MLKGIVTLITGGASGLGRATAERVIREGGRTCICDLPTSKGAGIANSLGTNATFAPTDVSSPADVENALNICKDKFGRLDVVVNCAGIARGFEMFGRISKIVHKMEAFDEVLKVNLSGSFNVIRLAAILMSENEPDAHGQRGVIVNTSSVSAFEGVRGQAAFSASSGGIVAMTLPVARDLAPLGIRVCTIAPGLFSTPLTDEFPDDVVKYLHMSTLFPKRFGKPDEYAQMVQTIITNPMMNGEVIRLDGRLSLDLYETRSDS